MRRRRRVRGWRADDRGRRDEARGTRHRRGGGDERVAIPVTLREERGGREISQQADARGVRTIAHDEDTAPRDAAEFRLAGAEPW